MNRHTHRTILIGFAAVMAAATVGTSPAWAGPGSSSGGSAKSGYNAIPSKVTGNVPSTGFEATATTEFGDEVTLGGSARTLKSMSVLMSSWGCESGSWQASCTTTPGATFTVPLTFTVYADDGGTAGAALASSTQSVAIAYRPSASAQCTGANAGKWYSSKDRTCYSGYPQLVTMTFPAVTLPTSVFWAVAYNTTHYGASPVGEGAGCFSEDGGCGYDSLNVGDKTFANSPYAGTDVDEDSVFRNGAMESGWAGYRPLGALATG
jgi:hypothetical protein